jgi:hypothetical protein
VDAVHVTPQAIAKARPVGLLLALSVLRRLSG